MRNMLVLINKAVNRYDLEDVLEFHIDGHTKNTCLFFCVDGFNRETLENFCDKNGMNYVPFNEDKFYNVIKQWNINSCVCFGTKSIYNFALQFFKKKKVTHVER